MKIRINKYLSNMGVASRRKVEEAIKAGKVSVNNELATVGKFIDSEKDEVTYTGKLITGKIEKIYLALNKPKNVLSTASDDRGRPTVMEYAKNINNRVYPIGRLDFSSTGLILLTNDGDLALRLTHPRYHLPKTYIVETKETISNEQLKNLEEGIILDNEKTAPAETKRLNSNVFEITLYQGMKRQIREMCKKMNLTVINLKRISIGPIKLGALKEGETRTLTEKEIEMLKGL